MPQPIARPSFAFAIPLVLVIVGLLDVYVALMPAPGATGIAGALLTISSMNLALTGILELTCAALVAMRRLLGRSLYRYGIPVTIVMGGTVSWLRFASADQPANASLPLSISVAFSIAIYVVVVYFLYRPAMSAWLSPPGKSILPDTDTAAGGALEIRSDDLSGPEIASFLDEHITEMKSVSPPESKHALDIEGLRAPNITFWTVWDDDTLVGCGAIKTLDATHAEIKSMRTHAGARGRGVGSMLLSHMLETARSRGHRRVSLETGSMAYFEPARRLYLKHGFEFCAPFGDYSEDPHSVFMTRRL